MTKRASRSKSAAGQAAGSSSPDHGALRTGRGIALLESLGLHGLGHLDAPVLAALASETPMLLIGPHGSAKSALLERLASALALEHRHYNASLVSFDDLVGFPVPEADGLRYLRTPATLWGAQSVFLDEISRCRPEVQNKLFSIVHERRVQGIALETLRYRWAAMNPPPPPDAADELDVYSGSLPLDPALADRFGFVLALPALEDLPIEARRGVIRSGLAQTRPRTAAIDLPGLVEACGHGTALAACLHEDWVTAYTSALVAPLRQAGLGISGRRAAMLAANIAAVHAARRALGDLGATGEPDALADSALTALRHSLPQRAQGRVVDAGVVLTLHRQAVDAAAQTQGDATLARILEESHPVRRVGLALAALQADPTRVARHTMSLLVADALASLDKQPRWVLTQELLPRLVELDCVDAPTLELLAEPFAAQVRFEQQASLQRTLARNHMGPFNELVASVAALDADDPAQAALGNLGIALFAEDEGAAEPASLEAQQAALRAQLDPADDRAA